MFGVNSASAEMEAVDVICGAAVQSVAGRDIKRVYIVVGYKLKSSGESYVLVSDGDKRKLESPKTKNPKHLKVIQICDDFDLESVTDEYIRTKLHDIDPLYKG